MAEQDDRFTIRVPPSMVGLRQALAVFCENQGLKMGHYAGAAIMRQLLADGGERVLRKHVGAKGLRLAKE